MTISTYESLMADKEHKQSMNRRQSALFFTIGLATSLLLVVTVFEWKYYNDVNPIDLTSGLHEDFQEILDIPLTHQPPPPPPQVNFNLVEIPDEEIIMEELDLTIDVEINEETVVADVIYDLEFDEPQEEVADEIFTVVEDQPEPIGGLGVFYKFITSHLKYPNIARKMGVHGKVYIRFVIEKDGSLSNVEVVKGIGAGCDKEAQRVLRMAPNWKPGKQRGKPVRVRVILPIHFVMSRNS